jgi:hypothetical protein
VDDLFVEQIAVVAQFALILAYFAGRAPGGEVYR